MARCTARFERHEESDQKTHTCDQAMGHIVQGVPHHCPRCDAWWRPRIGVVPDPRARAEPLGATETDAGGEDGGPGGQEAAGSGNRDSGEGNACTA